MASQLADELKRYATQELGFDLVGIAPAEPPPAAPHLAPWLAAGRHGTMSYLAVTAAVRTDPRRFLPGARAVVCVAVSYHEPPLPAELDPPPGHVLVARFARRRDYHDLFRERLQRLGAFLHTLLPSSQWRVAVDTAPLLEKALAACAGLGWIGKNTLLLHPTLGSELLLGELVTTAPLPPDTPLSSACGTCHACLDACPTGALDAPFQLDARRCISYLTLEHRKALAGDVSPQLASYLAGCDRCQLACPVNRAASLRRAPELAPRPDLACLSLASLQRLDEAGWQRLRRGTPLQRLNFPQFCRNVAWLTAART